MPKIGKMAERKRRSDRRKFKRAHKGRNPRDRHMKPASEPKPAPAPALKAWTLGDRDTRTEA